MSSTYRWLLKWARTTHLYTSLFSLFLVLFFSVTGFMLNHEDWFIPKDSLQRVEQGKLSLEPLREPDKLAVVEQLRKEFRASGEVGAFEVENERLRIVFKRPGVHTEAIVQREDGAVEVTTESRGMIGVFLDMHRGKSTGQAWSMIIDGTCIALGIMSLTGLILWFSLKGRGSYGLASIIAGTALAIIVYYFCVL